MIKYGTNYGGWYIPEDVCLNSDSIIYSGGVGEDISFDLFISDTFDCNIVLIDPTERSIKHYKEIIEFYSKPIKKRKNFKFSGNIQPDYINKIINLEPNLSKFQYLETALWNRKDKLNFYKQTNNKYVSQTLIPTIYGNSSNYVNVDSIKNIMTNLKNKKIDLLKIDIEGSEIVVLNNMLDNNIYPKYILVEYDLYLKTGISRDTDKLRERLKSVGYKELLNDNFNITYEYIEECQTMV